MTPIIEVSGLEYRYAGTRRPAVEGFEFRVERGEVFGFLGPSGVGKSTTQNVLTGLLNGYAGRVSVMGVDLAAWGADYYERIGVSFEFPNHFLKPRRTGWRSRAARAGGDYLAVGATLSAALLIHLVRRFRRVAFR